jgi:hypothetical protein
VAWHVVELATTSANVAAAILIMVIVAGHKGDRAHPKEKPRGEVVGSWLFYEQLLTLEPDRGRAIFRLAPPLPVKVEINPAPLVFCTGPVRIRCDKPPAASREAANGSFLPVIHRVLARSHFWPKPARFFNDGRCPGRKLRCPPV